MPVRNFWVEVEIDGRVHTLEGGPRSKDGKMVIDLRVREEGESVLLLSILCVPRAVDNEVILQLMGPLEKSETVNAFLSGRSTELSIRRKR